MSWFNGNYPSDSEMREELRRYLNAAHRANKHVPLTRKLLGVLWVQSRRRPYQDFWPALETLATLAAHPAITSTAIKRAFRDRLLVLQEGRCCYCRRWLERTPYAKPIEHILPRRNYPQYSLEYWNLAVACSDCNGIKSADVWGAIATTRRRYPRPHEFKETFHPRFHRYDEHVRYVRLETNQSSVVMFLGLTDQGRHLCRTLLHRIAAKETLVENNPALASSVNLIKKFESKAEGMGLERFEAFRQALDRSLLDLIE